MSTTINDEGTAFDTGYVYFSGNTWSSEYPEIGLSILPEVPPQSDDQPTPSSESGDQSAAPNTPDTTDTPDSSDTPTTQNDQTVAEDDPDTQNVTPPVPDQLMTSEDKPSTQEQPVRLTLPSGLIQPISPDSQLLNTIAQTINIDASQLRTLSDSNITVP